MVFVGHLMGVTRSPSLNANQAKPRPCFNFGLGLSHLGRISLFRGWLIYSIAEVPSLQCTGYIVHIALLPLSLQVLFTLGKVSILS